MDYKNKYEDALKRCRKLYNEAKANEYTSDMEDYEFIFPELVESDEKIRKTLIRFFKDQYSNETEMYDGSVTVGKAITWLETLGEQASAIRWYDVSLIPQEMEELLVEWNSEDATWHEIAFYHPDTKTFWNGTRQVENVTRWCYIIDLLEKQGEQKPVLDFKASNWYVSKVDGKIHDMTYNPTDKDKPKFKVGDWVVNRFGDVWHIDSFDSKNYQVSNGDKYCYFPIKKQNEMHLWTIQDAKNGDVLACGDKVTDCPFIFHNLSEELNPRSYCGVAKCQQFQYNDENCGFWCHSDEVRPATKEQRELLFKKMEEAGYEWDAEKKDEVKINRIVACLENLNVADNDILLKDISWLKSLKERGQKKQQH